LAVFQRDFSRPLVCKQWYQPRSLRLKFRAGSRRLAKEADSMTRVLTMTVAAVASVLALSAPAVAQSSSVTASDIDRLQYALDDARNEVSTLRSRDSALADRLQSQLDDMREEVTYLKVRLRKERTVPRSDYNDLRDRIDDIRNRARSDSRTSSGQSGSRYPDTRPSDPYDENQSSTSTPRSAAPNEIPSGQEIDVRLQTELNSGSAQVEDRFEATTLVDLYQDDRVLVPAGSVMRGVVTSVDPASRTDRKGSLTVSFDQLTVNGHSHPIRATVTQALESEGIKGETGKIATGAGVGAIIGGILGGFKGALAGILIGGGGTVVATEGKNVDLEPGTILRVRFDSPVVIR
jgi:hypothetical protein